MKVVAFLPVKGTSSRIESKNIKLLDGIPLFLHTLDKLMKIKCIDEVYLDTECEDVIALASEYSCNILHRDPALANNKTDGNKLFMNEVRQVEADIYIQILATSPFISSTSIVEGVEKVKNDNSYDSAVLLHKEKQYNWNDEGPLYDVDSIPNSVDLPDTITETMGLYIIKRDAALKLNKRLGENPYHLLASPLEKVDVNFPEDFELASIISAGLREKRVKLLDNLKNHLSSPMLSDILDDLGFKNQVVGGFSSLLEQKIFGPAKTLKLRKMDDGEDFKGIYDALDSYDTIVPNDIIVVENEVPDYAYFGELNANMAIRSGATGVIVGGVTRDCSKVLETGLPVYAKGSFCQDVRGRAVMESYNKSISLFGVNVSPGSLIFADSEGVVVIPFEVERQVIERVFEVLEVEKNVLVDIAKGKSVRDVIDEFGAF